jgi:endonuclease/exonuclease/phosphatase family metal-dependent hydrolase
MRVATWNLLHGLDVRTGRVDLATVAEGIADLDVDVVAVQEVDREQSRTGGVDQVAELAAKLGWFGVFAPALLGNPARRWGPGPGADADPGGPAYGVGLLSKHPLRAVARLALPGGGVGERRPEDVGRTAPGRDREPRVMLRAEVGTTGVVITTTHLSYLPWRGVRQLRLAIAWARAAGGIPLLMGDLNLPHRALRPALAAAGWSVGGAGPTFPSWRPGMQLDHILARRGRLRDVRVGARGPSDHLPVIGRIVVS